MIRTVIFYALGLAVCAFALEWLQYKYLARTHGSDFYLLLIAAACTGLGGWAGWRLTRKDPPAPFAVNEAALKSLGVSPREYEALELLAAGLSNKEIARKLGVSPNTVKTHLARLYEKLGAARRTEAVKKARELALIP